MSAARKTDSAAAPKTPHESGEHVRDLETLIRRSLEPAVPALQSTTRMTRFDLDDALANPAARPTGKPPPPGVAMEIPSLPLPAVEIDRNRVGADGN